MQKFKIYILASDIVSLYLALVLALIVRGLIHTKAIQTESVWLAAHIYIFLPSVIFSILALYVAGLYDAKIIYDRAKTVALLVYTQAATAIFTVLSFYVFHTELTPKLTLFFYVLISIFILSITRSIVFSSLRKMQKPKAILLTNDEKLKEKIEVSYGPYAVELGGTTPPLKGEVGWGPALIYDEKLLSPDLSLQLEKLKNSGTTVYSYNQYYEFLHKKLDLENVYINDLIRKLGERKETQGHFLVRRVVDISLGLIIYPIYLLSIPFIYMGIYLQDKGEIYSKQNRIGFLGKQIWLWKIRTMTHTDNGALRDDKEKQEGNKLGNRYTKFGMFLRKSRIDELPQCINLLNGDVSFIGPRALVQGVFNELNSKIPNFSLRLLAPQGLTGWAQVHMNYQPKTFEEESEKFAYDLYYIKYRSLFLDFSIILKTIKTVLSREGA